MVAGHKQVWRILNASANTFVAPKLVLSLNGQTSVQPLTVIARDGVPVTDDAGNRHNQVVDTETNQILLAPASRLEIMVKAPPVGGTLYLDSYEVNPGCAGDGNPYRRLLRAVSFPTAQPNVKRRSRLPPTSRPSRTRRRCRR